jgi:hypothetical protein
MQTVQLLPKHQQHTAEKDDPRRIWQVSCYASDGDDKHNNTEQLHELNGYREHPSVSTDANRFLPLETGEHSEVEYTTDDTG